MFSIPPPQLQVPSLYHQHSWQACTVVSLLNIILLTLMSLRSALLLWSWWQQSTDSDDLREGVPQCGMGCWRKRDSFNSSTVTAEHWISKVTCLEWTGDQCHCYNCNMVWRWGGIAWDVLSFISSSLHFTVLLHFFLERNLEYYSPDIYRMGIGGRYTPSPKFI